MAIKKLMSERIESLLSGFIGNIGDIFYNVNVNGSNLYISDGMTPGGLPINMFGPTGPQGDTGPVGPQGIIGNTGPTGPVGSSSVPVSSNIIVFSAVPYTSSATAINITNVSIGSGKWLVHGNAGLNSGISTSVLSFSAWISENSATMPLTNTNSGALHTEQWPSSAEPNLVLPTGCIYFNLSSNTTVYLSCSINYNSSNPSVYGFLEAIPLS